MKKLRSILGNTGAVLTLAVAVLVPFALLGWIQQTIGAAHLRIDPTYSGGEPSHVLPRDGYRIMVNRPVRRRSPLQRVAPFVQVTWTPADRLPAHVSDAVDLDGDGISDVRVDFDSAPGQPLSVDAVPLNRRYQALKSVRIVSFSALIARVGEGIVVRIPLASSPLSVFSPPRTRAVR